MKWMKIIKVKTLIYVNTYEYICEYNEHHFIIKIKIYNNISINKIGVIVIR